MRDFDPMNSFGADVAAVYDDELRGDESETVACLLRLAAGGPVLELAVGTGRIAPNCSTNPTSPSAATESGSAR